MSVQAIVLLIQRGTLVSYRYSFEDLLAVLHGHAPAKVDAVALHRRRVEHGHLSVGLKIHCLDDAGQFTTLVEGLGGAHKILDHLTEFCRKCSLCFRSTAVSWSGNPAFSIKEIPRDSCSSTRLGTHRYSGDDSQSSRGTQANTYSDTTRSQRANSDPGEGSLGGVSTADNCAGHAVGSERHRAAALGLKHTRGWSPLVLTACGAVPKSRAPPCWSRCLCHSRQGQQVICSF